MKLALILITQSLGTFVLLPFSTNNNLNIFVTQLGVGGLYKVLYGRLHLKVHIYLYHFDRKGTSFVDLSLQKGTCTPLQAYLRILHPFSIPLETSWTMLQNPLMNSGCREWMRAFQQHFRTRRMKSLNHRFTCPFTHLNLWNPYPFIIIPDAWKGYPFWAEPPQTGHCRWSSYIHKSGTLDK